jgi:hypothetical protein
VDDLGGHSDRSGVCWNVMHHDCVRADSGMFADSDRAQDLSSSTDIDMPAQDGNAGAVTPNRDLLEKQAVRADDRIRGDDDAVGMRDQQPAADLAINGDVRAGDDGPKAVPPPGAETRKGSRAPSRPLIGPHRREKRPRGIPVPPALSLAAPIWYRC